MTKRVVVGADGSSAACRAAQFAAREAARRGAVLEVMHSFEVPITAVDPMGAAYVAVDQDELVASARTVLATEADRLRAVVPGVAIQPSLHEGSARTMLVDASKDAELVVVGTEQANELTGFVLGSVCRHVLHRAHCPVAVVPTLPDGASQEEMTMSKIIVGVDGSEQSRAALDWAWEEAKLWKAPLHIVHAWVYPYAYGHRVTISEPVELVKLDASHLLDHELSELRARKSTGDGDGVEVHAQLIEGSPTEVILRESKDADLIVVGSRGRGGFLSLMLGSVAHQVSNHASCPVVVVRSPEA